MSGHKDKIYLLHLDELDEIRKAISVCVLDFIPSSIACNNKYRIFHLTRVSVLQF